MEKKKLIINAAVCDARNVSETILDSYRDISINAAMVLVSRESKDLMAKYNVSMNAAEVLEVSKDAEIIMQNGSFEITDATLYSKPIILIVNGSLHIKTGSQDVLDKFMLIQVNGSVSYPSDIKDKLPMIKVNGGTDCYPGDAIRLKNKLIMDKTFILRAKSEKYYVKSKVVIKDKNINIASLNEKGASFITKKAVILEDLLEEALPLFNEDADIKVIPPGLAYTDSHVLDDALIRKHGNRLYVDGDLTINPESKAALDKLVEINVEGTVFISNNLSQKFLSLNPEYDDLEETKGYSIGDKPFLTVDRRKLEKHEDGLRVFDCGIVNIKEEISPEEIEQKLELVDCGVVNCSEEQKSAVEMVSKDVGLISDGKKGKLGLLKDLFGGLAQSDENTKVINAANYTL